MSGPREFDAAATDQERNAVAKKQGYELIGISYDPSMYEWSPTPPDDGTCRECFEWRRYPDGQRHFGFAWWLTCDIGSCPHAHHLDETWAGLPDREEA